MQAIVRLFRCLFCVLKSSPVVHRYLAMPVYKTLWSVQQLLTGIVHLMVTYFLADTPVSMHPITAMICMNMRRAVAAPPGCSASKW